MEQLAAEDAAGQEHVTVDEIDGLLEAIDAVLEQNAAVFVAEYIQQGGQ